MLVEDVRELIAYRREQRVRYGQMTPAVSFTGMTNPALSATPAAKMNCAGTYLTGGAAGGGA